MVLFASMAKVKPILLLCALLFASVGGCFGPLMASQRPMKCCSSMPCGPASQAMSCCTATLPGAASHLQQTAEVTAPTVAYGPAALVPRTKASPVALAAMHRVLAPQCYSPPGDLCTIHHSFLI